MKTDWKKPIRGNLHLDGRSAYALVYVLIPGYKVLPADVHTAFGIQHLVHGLIISLGQVSRILHEPFIPGIAPKDIPIATPPSMDSRHTGFKTLDRTVINIYSAPFLKYPPRQLHMQQHGEHIIQQYGDSQGNTCQYQLIPYLEKEQHGKEIDGRHNPEPYIFEGPYVSNHGCRRQPYLQVFFPKQRDLSPRLLPRILKI